MPTFLLESGRLAPVAHPGVVPDGFTDGWCTLVRPDVLDLAGCDAFPVVWDSGSPPLLNAMRADGAGLAVAVLPRLDLVTLAELLARAGQVAEQSWADLAGRYPRGVAVFRRDWNAFREGRALPAQSLPGLVVVTGSTSAQVRQALPLLGRVQILLAQVRRSQGGAHLLDLEPMDASGPGPGPGARTTRPDDRTVQPGSRAPQPDAPSAQPGDRTTRRDDRTARTGRTKPNLPAAVTDAPSSSAAAGEHRGAPTVSAATRVRSQAPASAPTPPRPAEAGCPDLRQVAAMMQVPVPIEYHHGSDRQQATLNPSGQVEFPDGTRYTDLARASAALGSTEAPDPWQAWRFTDGQFPLAEARAEARRIRARSNGSRAARSPQRGRRART